MLLLLFLVLLLVVTGLAYYLLRPLPTAPQPATFHCLPTGPDDGVLAPFDLNPTHIYSMGLTYSGHIKETATSYNPKAPPPVFRLAPDALRQGGGVVEIPSRQSWLAAAEQLEPGLGRQIDAKFSNLPVLLDYEVELGLVLLEDITATQLDDPAYSPKLGYFIANDLTSRSFQVLGAGQENTYEYWSVAKSFPGFAPVGDSIWIPATQQPNSVLCTTLVTTVNNEIRQQQSVTDMIYTPKQMLRWITQVYPDASLLQGDMVLTGTPSGVALSIPRWRRRLAELMGLSRFAVLSSVIGAYKADPRFLQPGDRVTVSSPHLGAFTVVIQSSG